jgi:protein dithiol oxidoreductase (disulfide-forming)
MNCETIDSFLDEHLVPRLSPAERQRAADHVRGCVRCSAAWAADEALRGETIAEPAPELFTTVLRRISAAPAQSETTRHRRWATLAAAAAAVAIVALAARWAVIEPDGVAPPAVSSVPPPPVDSSPFVPGRDYVVLAGASARPDAAVAADRIEVVEFFMPECFPCYAFEPELARWEAEAPSDVVLARVPAMFNPLAELHARAYYTAEALGKLDTIRAEIYDEIHERGNSLGSRDALTDFFGRFGVDRATFEATFDSSEVDARLRRAAALGREYSVSATPTIVVAGRYSTNPGLAVASLTEKSAWGTALLAVVDQLVAESRSPR